MIISATLENDSICTFKNDNIYTMKMIISPTLENYNIKEFKNYNFYTMKNDNIYTPLDVMIFECRGCYYFSLCKCYHF